VAANATTATFTVTSKAVSAQASPQITGTLNGSASATLTVNPPTVLSVSLNPTTVAGGSTNSTGTVTLTGPAPSGGISVALSSGNTAAATVPASVAVAAGAASATFTVTSKSVTTTSTAVITASLNGSANARLTVNPQAAFTPIRVNSGGPAYTDSLGQVWSADTGYSGGSTYTVSGAIANTNDPTLYRTERWGSFTYSFKVPSGTYSVTLKFAETSFNAAGNRVFSVAINGTTMLSNFDIYAAAGGANTAVDRTFQVTSSGTVSIQFIVGSADQPKVDAIQIQ